MANDEEIYTNESESVATSESDYTNCDGLQESDSWSESDNEADEADESVYTNCGGLEKDENVYVNEQNVYVNEHQSTRTKDVVKAPPPLPARRSRNVIQ